MFAIDYYILFISLLYTFGDFIIFLFICKNI
nr:MAG TPA: hypothetical protein [Caudoviricetes sp.]